MRVWTSDYGEDEAALIAQSSLGEAPLDISIKIPDMILFWAETLEADILLGRDVAARGRRRRGLRFSGLCGRNVVGSGRRLPFPLACSER